MMTKHDLSQLRYLEKEIESLKRQIEKAEPQVVTDSVKGSSKNFPYTPRRYIIQGMDMGSYERKVARLQRQLKNRLDELMNKRAEIEKFISTIDDSLMRQIISLRYVDGLRWDQVAARIGGGNTADGVRKQHDRFIKTL